MADKKKFIDAFISTWEVHKSGEPTEIILDAYWDSLKKYSNEKISAAFAYAVRGMQWFPKPVELIKYIENGPGDVQDIAMIEADKVVNAIKSVGAYESVCFDDPVTMAVIENGWGGWIKMCEIPEAEVKWFKKDFAKLYVAYSSQNIKQHGHLSGIIEHENRVRFPKAVPSPVLIGDKSRAKIVLEHNRQGLIE